MNTVATYRGEQRFDRRFDRGSSFDRDRRTFLIGRTRVTTASIGFYQTVSQRVVFRSD